jgi:hypothetical protein
MRPCPISLKVLCIIGISWAALGLISVLGSLAFHFVTLPSTPSALIAMKKEPLYIAMTFGLGFASIAVDLLLLIGSIKSLKVEKRGRTLLLAYVWSKFAISAVGTPWTLGYVMPHTYSSMAMPAGAGPAPPGLEEMMKVVMYVGACGGILMLIAMPVYILITLRLKKVRDAYEGLYAPEGSFEPMMRPPAA